VTSEEFRQALVLKTSDFQTALSDDEGDWLVKGFIDVYRNVYAMTTDTKVVSKVAEIMLFPVLSELAAENGLRMVLAEHQNHYPDISYLSVDGDEKWALDIKTTYRTGETRVNGFTLGAYTGYFRERALCKNTTYPYSDYSGHFVLGAIYTRSEDAPSERQVFDIDQLQDIASVIRDFEFIVQEKWRIARDRPGSGNTRNIGSVNDLQQLRDGSGPFSELGDEVFDDYWTNYLNAEMSRAIESPQPYNNLASYYRWKKRGLE